MAKIRERDRNAILDALAGGVTPRQGIQHIQVGRLAETNAIIKDIDAITDGRASARIIDASYGSGKLLPLDMPVLTDHGWVQNGDIEIGDKVYTRNGHLSKVTGIYPESDVETYELHLADDRVVEAGPDHLWIVVDTETGDESVLTTSAIKETIGKSVARCVVNGGMWKSPLAIPTCSPIETPDTPLDVPPYVMGAFIGNGIRNIGNGLKHRCETLMIQIKDRTDEREIAQRLADSISSEIAPVTPWQDAFETPWKFDTGLYTKDFKKIFMSVADTFGSFDRLTECTEEDVYIPEIYKTASAEQRFELLEGIADTSIGGTRDKTGQVGLYIDSEKLAADIVDVARSLGMSATIAERTFLGAFDVEILGFYPHGDPHMLGNVPVDIVSVNDTGRRQDMQCLAVCAENHSYIVKDYTVTHNTFVLTLSKSLALKRNLFTMTADFSPDRRLYASDGKANALYRELVRSLSCSARPDGGALEYLLDALDDKISIRDAAFMSDVRRLPYGYDAVTVLNAWNRSKHPETKADERDAFIIQDACLRWFAGENTQQHKKLLGVKSSIGDDGAYDALKLIAMLVHYAGYAGMLVELDECVNLYKINNTASRDRNYEQILRIFNECRQGDAQYIGFIFAGTPEFVADPRRGLFSYEALRSRLVADDFAVNGQGSGESDMMGPIIDLSPLSQEDLLVLLGNITNVEALGKRENWLVDDAQMQTFLKKYFDALGADYFRTPREIIRSFVMLLLRMRESGGELSFEQALGGVEVKREKKVSGLGAKVNIVTRDDSPESDGDDEDFGF